MSSQTTKTTQSPYTIQVLDKGFVTLRNLSGPTRRIDHDIIYSDLGNDLMSTEHVFRPFDADDTDPANSARMSFEQMDSGRTYEQEMKLNEYLLKNEHSSPFEMIQVWLEVKVPIFIDRQLVRHRTWRRSESSGRYVVLPSDWYIPETVGGKPVGNAKQGQSDTLDPATQLWFKAKLSKSCENDYDTYLEAIHLGVAAEHARMLLHLNHYVHWLGNVDLGNLFKFMRLRVHSHAQLEARKYAEAVVNLLRPQLPGLMDLFDKHCRRVD